MRSGRVEETETVLGASMEGKDEDKLRSFAVGLVSAVHSASAGGLSQIDPVGGPVAGAREAWGIHQGFQ